VPEHSTSHPFRARWTIVSPGLAPTYVYSEGKVKVQYHPAMQVEIEQGSLKNVKDAADWSGPYPYLGTASTSIDMASQPAPLGASGSSSSNPPEIGTAHGLPEASSSSRNTDNANSQPKKMDINHFIGGERWPTTERDDV
jgi:hypothetical protein